MAFQGYLRPSTATFVNLGDFVDITDGVTYKIAMATEMNHATTGVRISKNGAAFITRNTATIPVYQEMGYYRVDLDTTDTNTVGRLKIIFSDPAVCLSAQADYLVLEEAIYDALIAGTGTLQGDMIKILGTSIAGTGTLIPDSFKAMFNVATPTFTAQSVNQTGDNFPLVSTEVAEILADTNELQGLISSSKIAAQVKGIDADAITASALKTDAVNEITAAIWAKVVDGTITFEKMSKILLAFTSGKVVITSNSFAFYDQSNVLLFTLPITTSGRIPVIA